MDRETQAMARLIADATKTRPADVLAQCSDFAALRAEALRLTDADTVQRTWWNASINGRKAKRRARRKR